MAKIKPYNPVSLIRSGVNYLFTWLRSIGKSDEYAEKAAMENPSYQLMTEQQRRAGVELGRAAWEAGQKFPSLKDEEGFRPQTVPVNPQITERWRYVITVEYFDPDDGEIKYRGVVINSDDRLSKRQIFEKVVEWWEKSIQDKPDTAPSSATEDNVIPSIHVVQSVERRE